jgi:predicted transposase YbfD/YdcC
LEKLGYSQFVKRAKIFLFHQKEGRMAKDGKVKQKKVIENIIKTDGDEQCVQGVAAAFLLAVDDVHDERDIERCDHLIQEILFVAVVAVLCGSESHRDMQTFAETQIEWLRQFIKLEHGAPSHDTFRRVLETLKPGCLDEAVREMFQQFNLHNKGDHIAIDGKVLRGCYNIKGMSLLRTVSAWDTENGISLAQVATKNDEGKDVGEFNAIPVLIDTLDIKGKTVTIDAGGAYVEITGAVVNGGGDYAITLKENQPTLYKEAVKSFQKWEERNFEGIDCYEESNRGHGRQERRTYRTVSVTDEKLLSRWPGLQTLVMGLFQRTVSGVTTEYRRYYFSSLACEEVERLGHVLRKHWSIENNFHWVLDVSFGEDGNRTRRGHGAENLSILRRAALSILNQHKGKMTIPNMKFRAALDPVFRTKLFLKPPM